MLVFPLTIVFFHSSGNVYQSVILHIHSLPLEEWNGNNGGNFDQGQNFMVGALGARDNGEAKGLRQQIEETNTGESWFFDVLRLLCSVKFE